MKKLTRHELATVRKVASINKVNYGKILKLEDKIKILNEEIEGLLKQIEVWEGPVKEITGGVSSNEYLALYEANKLEEGSEDSQPKAEVSPAAENDFNFPMGNPGLPEEAINEQL